MALTGRKLGVGALQHRPRLAPQKLAASPLLPLLCPTWALSVSGEVLTVYEVVEVRRSNS